MLATKHRHCAYVNSSQVHRHRKTAVSGTAEGRGWGRGVGTTGKWGLVAAASVFQDEK